MGMLESVLESGKFGITVEMAPPKGYDFSEQMEAAELLKGKVHGVNVTDMQSACLKASSLGLCIKLKEAGLQAKIVLQVHDELIVEAPIEEKEKAKEIMTTEMKNAAQSQQI